ncbi:hypothetical protein E2C01_020144 [Portunus trituberculatus]|uniref:Uncharacterized protein n=1 Tax=Portunus trituberculatus TaxID=210409 RepID=A0A5B7DZ17_PORTR|nr:hypothetical protein [Portunus trituberculatus]
MPVCGAAVVDRRRAPPRPAPPLNTRRRTLCTRRLEPDTRHQLPSLLSLPLIAATITRSERLCDLLNMLCKSRHILLL